MKANRDTIDARLQVDERIGNTGSTDRFARDVGVVGVFGGPTETAESPQLFR